jgi:DNA-binding LytR/AlgR family response regulator
MSNTNPSAPRAIVADDERLMRDQLRARLKEAWPELEIVAEAKNGAEAVALVEQHRPDLIFLDIRMPGMTGIEAARAIAQLPDEPEDGAPLPHIVFITAFDEYAVQAFEQGAADYVLKPAERERLAVTVQRLRQRLQERAREQQGSSEDEGSDTSAQSSPPSGAAAQQPMQRLLHQLAHGQVTPAYLQWIQASVGSSIQMIAVDEVLFFISDEKYTRVQTAHVEALIRKPIKELVDELDPNIFWQIHRSTLVNARAIAGVARDLRGRQIVSVKGHAQKLEVSRSYLGLFKGM